MFMQFSAKIMPNNRLAPVWGWRSRWVQHEYEERNCGFFMLFNMSPSSFCFYREKDVSGSNAFTLLTALDQSRATGFYKRMSSKQNVPEIDKMHCAATCVLDPICMGFTVNLHPHPQCVTYDDEISTNTLADPGGGAQGARPPPDPRF